MILGLHPRKSDLFCLGRAFRHPFFFLIPLIIVMGVRTNELPGHVLLEGRSSDNVNAGGMRNHALQQGMLLHSSPSDCFLIMQIPGGCEWVDLM